MAFVQVLRYSALAKYLPWAVWQQWLLALPEVTIAHFSCWLLSYRLSTGTA